MAGRAGRKRILIVDDYRPFAFSLRFMLSADHEVLEASDGKAALAILRSDDRFDCVLCDVTMPELSGLDLYEEVRRTAPELARRFVFMSGDVTSWEERARLGAIPNPRLEKPFARAAIEAALKELW